MKRSSVFSKGFTILEFSIAFFISSIITISLIKLIPRSVQNVALVNNYSDNDSEVLIFYDHFFKDVTGIFNVLKQNREKKRSLYIKDILHAKSGIAEFIFSFISTSSLKQIDKDGKFKKSPSIYRVAYFTKPSLEIPGAYDLYYAFSNNNLSLDSIRSSNYQFKILTGLSKLDISFNINKNPESQVELNSWDESTVFEKHKVYMPDFVKISGFLNYKTLKGGKDFEFKVRLYSHI